MAFTLCTMSDIIYLFCSILPSYLTGIFLHSLSKCGNPSTFHPSLRQERHGRVHHVRLRVRLQPERHQTGRQVVLWRRFRAPLPVDTRTRHAARVGHTARQTGPAVLRQYRRRLLKVQSPQDRATLDRNERKVHLPGNVPRWSRFQITDHDSVW